MLPFVVMILSFVISYIFTAIGYYKIDNNLSFAFEFGFMASVLIAIVCTFLAFIPTFVYMATWEPHYSCNGYITMVAINDSTTTHGRFALFSGYVNEDWQYFYYYPVDNGYRMASVPTDQSIIEESNTESPKIWVCTPDNDKATWWHTANGGAPTKYRIIVPKGTIVQKYTLDLAK